MVAEDEVKAEENNDENLPPAYFLSLTVENIRCFGPRQILDLSKGNDQPAQWTVILGNSGTGKTTLLQCLAMLEPVSSVLLDEPEVMMPRASKFLGDYNWESSVYRGENELFISGAILSGHTLTGSEQGEVIKEFYFRGTYGNRNSNLKEAAKVGGLVCYSYGALRRMGIGSLADKARYDYHGISLFDDNASLLNAEQWLLKLDYAASKPSDIRDVCKEKLELLREVFIGFLPGVTDIDFRISGEDRTSPQAQFKTNYGWVSMNDLSLGYKTMIAWMADLSYRLIKRYPESPDPLAEPAIVLIDEIDLHLPPQWQRDMIRFLSERFVNTQFIVTAHNPLIVQWTNASRNKENKVNFVVLEQEKDYVLVKNDEKAIRDWRINQIVASELFGLVTHSYELEKILSKRRNLFLKDG
ncbi:AAA family ATPase [Desulfonema magnum]|uniref:AAA ATPase-like domain-containing protein n=1 Tax=Desulfonema magnum TaxID=45655 RepID=A0A975BQY2_9BACT|nr:AAA family ATPase [Desulfonema magnum]QTA89763.1 AAA ATPase-like domain-containing protein [Desulfonema magnum]